MCVLLVVHYFLVELAVSVLQLYLQLDVLLMFLVELYYYLLTYLEGTGAVSGDRAARA
jgi:hypothetical protein